MDTVTIVVDWGSSKFDVFEREKEAEDHLKKLGLDKLTPDQWGNTFEDIDQGISHGVYVKKIRKANQKKK